MKAATNEEVNQMIEDRKVNFNQNWHFKLNANPKEAMKSDADINMAKIDLHTTGGSLTILTINHLPKNEGGTAQWW